MRGRILFTGLLLLLSVLFIAAPTAAAAQLPKGSGQVPAQQEPQGDDTAKIIAEIDQLQEQLRTSSGFTPKDGITLGGTALSTFVGALAALAGIRLSTKASNRVARNRQILDIELKLWEKSSLLLRRIIDAINSVADHLSSAVEVPIRADERDYEQNVEKLYSEISRAQGSLIEADAVAARLSRPEIVDTLTQYIDAAKRLSATLERRTQATVTLLSLHQQRNDLNDLRRELLGELEEMEADIDSRLRKSVSDAA
jgi:hypothetical protein